MSFYALSNIEKYQSKSILYKKIEKENAIHLKLQN